jgi:lipopolysaccharide transport protein LptA
MQRILVLITTLTLLFVLAQEEPQPSTPQPSEPTQTEEATPEQTDEEKRIIRIDSSGGDREGDFRFGPITYTHPDPEGIKATVSNLSIFGQRAELKGPEGEEVTLTDAEGRRIATFSGGLRVTRNRLTANGPDLIYTEEDGLGKMTGNVTIVVAPKEDDTDGEPVNISAESADFDVDTDVSISRGNVDLVNGNQTAQAQEMIYEEERELGKLTSEGDQVTMTREADDGDTMTITADEVRVLTDSKKLHAIGNVTVVDGSITSQGTEVFFNDEENRAEIVGTAENPATSVDEDEGIELEGERIEQRTDTDAISVLTSPSEFDATEFLLLNEQETPSEE